MLRRFLCTMVEANAPLLCPSAAAASALAARVRPLLPKAAQHLVDGGILRKMRRGRRRFLCSSDMKEMIEAAPTTEEKHELVVAFTLLTRRLIALENGQCNDCLYPVWICQCGITPIQIKHKLYLFQHVGEFARHNNSGRLLRVLLDAKIAIQGIRTDVDEMMHHAYENRDSSVVLFPTADSLTIGEYRRMRERKMGANAAQQESLTLFLPDGTSNQAKNLERNLPSYLPRIRIDGDAIQSWLDPLRRQTEEHRVCTAQAAAMVLAELGENEVVPRVKAAVESFIFQTELHRGGLSKRSSIWTSAN